MQNNITDCTVFTGFPSALVPMSITKMFSSSAAAGNPSGYIQNIWSGFFLRNFRINNNQQHQNNILYIECIFISRRNKQKPLYCFMRNNGHTLSGIAASYILTCIFFANNSIYYLHMILLNIIKKLKTGFFN